MLRALFLLATLLGGCTTITVGDGAVSRTFIGVVRVVTPEAAGAVNAIDVETVGLGWDRGPFLGWHSGSWITADPARCQLLIVIRSPAQAENAATVLRALEGQDPCIADYTYRLPR